MARDAAITIDALVLLHPADNVLIARRRIAAGESVAIDGQVVIATGPIELAHKVARHGLVTGDKVMRYGAPIGSMTADAVPGEHIHLHNMKSDYIPSHGRDAVHVEDDAQ